MIQIAMFNGNYKPADNQFRETRQELTYFNNDLSKFIHYNCDKFMLSIDIDIYQSKKVNNKIYERIIEVKKIGANIRDAQKNALKRLTKYMPVYIIETEEPFTHNRIHKLGEKGIIDSIEIGKNTLIDFLNFNKFLFKNER